MKKSMLKRILHVVLLRDKPLMVKLTVYSAVLIVFPMFIIGVVSYLEFSNILDNEARRYSRQFVEQVKMYVEDYFRDYEISTLKIVNHPDTVQFLKLKSSEEVNAADIVPSVRNVLKNYAYSQSDIINITLILDGIQSINSAVYDGVSSVEGIEEEYWYETIPVTGRPKVYSRIIEWNNRTEPVISVVKVIANPQTLQRFGMLVIDVNYKRLNDLDQAVKLGEKNQGVLFMLDEQGHFVYHSNAAKIGTLAEPHIIQLLEKQSSGSLITEVDGIRTLLTYIHSESLQWQIVSSVPYDALMETSRNSIGKMIMEATAFFLLIALVLSITLSASLVNPIKTLYRYMNKVGKGDLKARLPVNSTDEIGKISNGFNMMMDRLSELLEEIYFSRLRETQMNLRQRETELKMLQAQINPHFLYNSLDTIRGMALERDNDDIGAMAAALAKLLRYNVENARVYVPLKNEVEIVELFLRIHHYRFQERLAYEIDIPDWALNQEIIKFTLQPLVENCIVHALDQSDGITVIQLTANKLSLECFEIVLKDNGPGIAIDKLSRLQQQLNRAEHTEESSIGMMNVQRRIRNVYGEHCGVRIESREGEGTVVRVILPYKELEGKE